MDRQAIRAAFRRSTNKLARVTETGFLIDGETHPVLVGRPVLYRLLRMRFEDGALLCDSPDGVRARNGTLCDTCRHPRCRPHLRLHLDDGMLRYVVDLAVSSAENLFAIEDQATVVDRRLEDCTLRLTIKPRGGWGEVLFEPVGT